LPIFFKVHQSFILTPLDKISPPLIGRTALDVFRKLGVQPINHHLVKAGMFWS